MNSLYSTTIIVYILQCYVYANMQVSTTRNIGGNVTFNATAQRRGGNVIGVVNGNGGVNGNRNGNGRNDPGEINMVQNAVDEYENQVTGGNNSKRKMIGTDANGTKVVCESARNGVEGVGSAQDALIMKKQVCLEEAKKRKDLADAMIKQSKGAKECAVKVNKRSMVCHTKKVIQNMIEKEVYEIQGNKNVVTLLKNHEPILMTVVEMLNYNVIKEEVPKDEKLDKPNIDIKFNELGGLLSQEGEIPVAKSENPCAVCMQQLTNKANTMEGNVDDCNFSCDSNMLTSFLKPGHFKEIKAEDVKKEPDTEHEEEEHEE